MNRLNNRHIIGLLTVFEITELRQIMNKFFNHFCLIMIFYLLIPNYHNVYGGSFTDFIKEECPQEFSLYSETVQEYAIRMKPEVIKHGCKIIMIYDTLLDEQPDLIDFFEEDNSMMVAGLKVFTISKTLNNILKQSSKNLYTILLIAQQDPDVFSRLAVVLEDIGPYSERQMKNNPDYILYYLLAAFSTKDLSTRQIKEQLKQIQRKISLASISQFSMLLLQATEIYPKMTANERLHITIKVMNRIGKKTIKLLENNKAYIALFLPPSKEEIDATNSLDDKRIGKIQEDYTEIIDFIFYKITKIKDAYYALRVIEHFQAPVIEALKRYSNKKEILNYLRNELESPRFAVALVSGICGKNGDEGLTSFTSMYSPFQNGQPVSGKEGNLGLIASWYTHGKLKQWMNEVNKQNLNAYIYLMGYLATFFKEFNIKQREVFQSLLKETSEDPLLNGMLIKTLREKTDYFNWLNQENDAFHWVSHNKDAIFGKDAQKYLYILITSYPGDNDKPLLYGFDGENLPYTQLGELMRISVDDLQTHNFAFSEKFEVFYDAVDLTISVGLIVAIPFTAGVSATALAMNIARKAAIAGTKQTIKMMSKYGAKRTLRFIAKQGIRNVRKTARKMGMKAVGKYASTRKGFSGWKKVLDKVDDTMFTVDATNMGYHLGKAAGVVLGGAIMFHLAFDRNQQEKDVCELIGGIK
jgi:hypothetical protein